MSARAHKGIAALCLIIALAAGVTASFGVFVFSAATVAAGVIALLVFRSITAKPVSA